MLPSAWLRLVGMWEDTFINGSGIEGLILIALVSWKAASQSVEPPSLSIEQLGFSDWLFDVTGWLKLALLLLNVLLDTKGAVVCEEMDSVYKLTPNKSLFSRDDGFSQSIETESFCPSTLFLHCPLIISLVLLLNVESLISLVACSKFDILFLITLVFRWDWFCDEDKPLLASSFLCDDVPFLPDYKTLYQNIRVLDPIKHKYAICKLFFVRWK